MLLSLLIFMQIIFVQKCTAHLKHTAEDRNAQLQTKTHSLSLKRTVQDRNAHRKSETHSVRQKRTA